MPIPCHSVLEETRNMFNTAADGDTQQQGQTGSSMFTILVIVLVLNSDAFQYGHLERRMALVMGGMEGNIHLPSTTADRAKTTMKKSLSAFSAYVAGITSIATIHPSVTHAINIPPCSDEIMILRSSNDREVVLIGTAHISEESVNLVSKVINDVRPDTVMVRRSYIYVHC